MPGYSSIRAARTGRSPSIATTAVRIVNQATGKAADVADCGTADGTDVREWTWLDTTCQQWKLTPVA